ncbi:YciI family protein [Amycolatopsis thermalba]|uniref:YciI family protein n=1 Tax=Amycolatopsis thermalba TaxID=944492 RepID=A0ABY4NT76_9PSEU|nr:MULTISPECIES: YciI family protein [Amycolatopsis]UQS23262.1 YciI family protein [Amycolatopsis thermalba]
MLHLLILRYLRGEADVAPHIAGHVEYLERHHAAGTFIASGQTVPAGEGGAILARGVDRAAALAITAEDPFVRAGVAEYSITTIDVGRAHPALAGLVSAA